MGAFELCKMITKDYLDYNKDEREIDEIIQANMANMIIWDEFYEQVNEAFFIEQQREYFEEMSYGF